MFFLVIDICEENFPDEDANEMTWQTRLAKVKAWFKDGQKRMTEVDGLLKEGMSDKFLDTIAANVNRTFIDNPCMQMDKAVPQMMDMIKECPEYKAFLEMAKNTIDDKLPSTSTVVKAATDTTSKCSQSTSTGQSTAATDASTKSSQSTLTSQSTSTPTVAMDAFAKFHQLEVTTPRSRVKRSLKFERIFNIFEKKKLSIKYKLIKNKENHYFS